MARTGQNIYKRKDGRWEARYIFSYNKNGKARYKYLYASSYKEVKAKLMSALTHAAPIILPNHYDKELYSYWLDGWLRAKKLSVKQSTYSRYLNHIEKHIKPELGKYPISKISTELMQQFVSNKLNSGRLDGTGGLSAKSVRDILAIIKESFKYAELYDVYSICKFERIICKREQVKMRVLNPSEESKLLSILLNDMDRYKLGAFLCLYTGIRIGELCALKWKNISLMEQTICIEGTMQRLQNFDADNLNKTYIIITSPKSFTSQRIIPIPDFVTDILKPFETNPDAYLLSGKKNTIVEPRTMQNHFKKYLLLGNINDANFHALRHTFATRCVESGFDIKSLSEILGHTSVKITLDRYVHSSMQQKRNNMEKLKLNIL